MKKQKKNNVLTTIKRSRPRPVVQNRPAVFENKKRYKRTRDKRVTERD